MLDKIDQKKKVPHLQHPGVSELLDDERARPPARRLRGVGLDTLDVVGLGEPQLGHEAVELPTHIE